MRYILYFIFSLNVYVCKCQPRVVKNIVVVTIDGIRWQEVFKGADASIINNKLYTQNSELAGLLYFDSNATESRKKLLPFFWNVLAQKGQLYGNRDQDNKVNVANRYKFSYPGYNEILTGYPNKKVKSNHAVNDENINVLEYLNSIDQYKNKVVAFASWNIFPYILNKDRNALPVYSGYDSVPANGNETMDVFNKLQDHFITEKKDTRQDALTFIAASEYMKTNKPNVMFVGFGECDEDAHAKRYDKYLQHLNEADKMIANLWYYIQSTPGYKDSTVLIITTDHGRGKRKNNWTGHGAFINGSADTWLAVIGAGIGPAGEVDAPEQLYQQQIAATISHLLGYNFTTDHPVAGAINFNSN